MVNISNRSKTVLAENLTWQEYEEEIGERIVILPLGALEQHGPHLPLNVDVVIPRSLALMVDKEIESIVFPHIAYGYKPLPGGGGQEYPGTTSLDGTTLINVILDILRCTYRHGARKYLLLNGHYENVAFATEAVELFFRDQSDARVLIVSWWDLVSQDILDEVFQEVGFPGWDTEHAGISETALMQYFAPDLVREDKIVDDESARKAPYLIFPPPDDIITRSGSFYKATYSSKEKGELLAKSITKRIVEITKQEFE
jgi:creatinine amidohydrolase